MAIVARNRKNGAVKLRVLPGITKKVFHETVKNRVSKSATLFTDEHTSYVGLDEHFKGGHHSVAHGKYEWARDDVHTNTVESLNRIIRGTFRTHYNMSKKHLQRHLEAVAFSWRHKGKGDVERTILALRQASGKRLRYDQLIRK